MNRIIPARPGRKAFTARRLALLASAAGLAIAVVETGTSGVQHTEFSQRDCDCACRHHAAVHGFCRRCREGKAGRDFGRVKVDATAKMTSMNDNDDANPMQPGAPLEKFFEQFSGRGMPKGFPQGKRAVTGEGSGFFISADGYAVTNNHVVDHAKTVQITMDDGSVYDAKVVGSIPRPTSL